jgi:hypothetical protein
MRTHAQPLILDLSDTLLTVDAWEPILVSTDLQLRPCHHDGTNSSLHVQNPRAFTFSIMDEGAPQHHPIWSQNLGRRVVVCITHDKVSVRVPPTVSAERSQSYEKTTNKPRNIREFLGALGIKAPPVDHSSPSQLESSMQDLRHQLAPKMEVSNGNDVGLESLRELWYLVGQALAAQVFSPLQRVVEKIISTLIYAQQWLTLQVYDGRHLFPHHNNDPRQIATDPP